MVLKTMASARPWALGITLAMPFLVLIHMVTFLLVFHGGYRGETALTQKSLRLALNDAY